jgi:hypothetical protein
VTAASTRPRSRRRPPAPQRSTPSLAVVSPAPSTGVHTAERQELLYSVIGLAVKLGLVAVVGVSLVRLGAAYQQRMQRQGEISAVLELEKAKLARARDRFDQLFHAEGEQRLIREQSQWIAPDRLRVVWNSRESGTSSTAASALPSVETAATDNGETTGTP